MSKTITISGVLQYRNGSPISGARVRIWETDPFQPWNNDDLIVNDETDRNGSFTGTGRWKDSGDPREIGTYRYEVKHGSKTIDGKNIVNPRAFFARLETPWDPVVKPQLGKGVTWTNWNDNFATGTHTAKVRKPADENEVETALRDAVRDGLKVKVVGSGHSMSAVAQPSRGQMVIDLSELSGGLRRYGFERPNVDNELAAGRSLARVRAGTTIRTTNVMLANNGLGLLNMGPFDGQKMAGVINTNTHGNGLRWGGFADMVRSVEMLVVRPDSNGQHGVERWIIEPTDGISDRSRFDSQHRAWKLAQDDDLFHSVVCGYGLFGVALSYVFEVRDFYWLRERAERTTWGSVRNRIEALANETRRHPVHQLKIYLHTAQVKYKPISRVACKIERLSEVPVEPKPNGWERKDDPLWPPMRKGTGVADVLSQAVGASFKIQGIAGTGRADPALVTALSKGFFKDSNDKIFNYGDKGEFSVESAYYRAIRRRRDTTLRLDRSKTRNMIDNTQLSRPPTAPDHAVSMELAVPVRFAAEAIEVILGKIKRGRINLLAPIGIRFSAGSDHLLCPAQGSEVAFLEISGTLPTMQRNQWPSYQTVYRSFFSEIEAAVRSAVRGTRTHLGKANTADASQLAADYPGFSRWLGMYGVFSRSGLFDCPIADEWDLPRAVSPISVATAQATMDALTR